jgi:hypothetical protein
VPSPRLVAVAAEALQLLATNNGTAETSEFEMSDLLKMISEVLRAEDFRQSLQAPVVQVAST